MRERARDRSAQTWAAARAAAVLRLAHQLTGDPAAAHRIAVAALADVARRHHPGDERSRDELLTRAALRALPRRPGAAVTRSGLDRLDPRARVAAVLAFGAGWDAVGIADATRTTPGRTRARVGAALAVGDQQEWERLLAEPRWALPTPVSLLADVERHADAQRRERRARVLAATAAVVALAGAVVSIVRTVTAPAPLPATAHEAGLLAWPARGDLVRDGGLLDRATRVWRAAPHPPSGHVYELWAGRVGVGRLVVLQGFDGDRAPVVAVVADHDVTFGHARLRLDAVDALPGADADVLAIPYDGNLNVAGLQSGPSQQVVQLLVRPGIDRVDERSSQAPLSVPSLRPPFRTRPLTDGLSEPWLDVRGDQATTAVRASAAGTVVFTGLVGSGDDVGVAAARPVTTDPPSAWAGLTRALAPGVLDDDGLWWAQVCHQPRPSLSLVWADPTSANRSRMEFVRCQGGPWSAQFLTDGSSGTEWAFTRVLRSADAVIGRLPRTELLVVVGDRSVATVVVGTSRFAGRTFVGPWPASTPLHVLDRHGRQLPL